MHRALVCFFFLISCLTYSQEPVYYHYDTHNGLPCSEIYDVIQDKYGYLWFSSDFGLIRYDGYTFKHFTTNDGLTNNIVFNFFNHPNGDIWCTTLDKSVFKISGEVPTFEAYKWNKHLKRLSPSLVFKQICFAENSTTLFSFINSGSYLSISNDGIQKRPKPISEDESLVINATFFKNDQKLVWFDNEESQNIPKPLLYSSRKTTTIKNLHRRNDAVWYKESDLTVFLNSKSITLQTSKESRVVAFNREPLLMGKFQKNKFWVSFEGGGVSIYDLSGQELDHFLPNQTVSSVILDHEGGIWISTLNNGVYHIINNQIRNSTNKTTAIFDLESDGEKLWISYKNGKVDQYKSGTYRALFQNEDNRPSPLYYDKKALKLELVQNGYILAQNPQYCGYTRTLFSEQYGNNYTAYVSNHNILKKHSQSGDIVTYDAPSIINSILRFRDTLFFGTHEGLFYLIGNSFYKYNIHNEALNMRINSLSVYKGRLLLGTLGEGLILIKGKNSIQKIDDKSGLTSSFVSNIYVENNNIIWACTNAGLNRIRFTTDRAFTIDQITTKEGLKSNEVNALTIFNDTCWVGTQEGLSYFSVNLLNSTNSIKRYRLKINSISVNDSVFVKPTKNLSYKQNRLEFHFSGISFNESSELEYRYKLEEVENHWTYTKNKNALYPQLPPGEYTFIVQIKGENDSWSTQSSTFSFTIHPPFWNTSWFICICIFVFVALNYLFFRYRILLFNGALVREILRVFLKRLKRENRHIVVNEGKEKVKILSSSIKYVKADGNYIKIHHDNGKTLTRKKISEFTSLTPDPLEYVQVRRSYIVRIDRVEQKSKKSLVIDGEKICVGSTYKSELEKIRF